PEAYESKQLELVDTLEGGGWERERVHPDRGTFASGGGFGTAPPLVIVRRGGAVLLGQLTDLINGKSIKPSLGEWLNSYGAGLELRPTGIDISIHALGVAVITADFTVEIVAEDAPRLSDLAAVVREAAWLRSSDGRPMSPLARALKRIATETAERYGRAVSEVIPETMRVPELAADSSGGNATSSTLSADDGRLLWLHPVTQVTTPHPLKDAARQLAPAFHETVKLGDQTLFAPGVGWSTIVSSPVSVDPAEGAARHRSWAGDPNAPIKLLWRFVCQARCSGCPRLGRASVSVEGAAGLAGARRAVRLFCAGWLAQDRVSS
ncbi:MAG: hypothetical protein LC777_20595, partial [Actinobacteria bacterium]|nr:hypothetical protein [Actinomycetota bacterium]